MKTIDYLKALVSSIFINVRNKLYLYTYFLINQSNNLLTLQDKLLFTLEVHWISIALSGLFALCYFIYPYDLINDDIPIYGYMDDFFGFVYFINKIRYNVENRYFWACKYAPIFNSIIIDCNKIQKLCNSLNVESNITDSKTNYRCVVCNCDLQDELTNNKFKKKLLFSQKICNNIDKDIICEKCCDITNLTNKCISCTIKQ